MSTEQCGCQTWVANRACRSCTNSRSCRQTRETCSPTFPSPEMEDSLLCSGHARSSITTITADTPSLVCQNSSEDVYEAKCMNGWSIGQKSSEVSTSQSDQRRGNIGAEDLIAQVQQNPYAADRGTAMRPYYTDMDLVSATKKRVGQSGRLSQLAARHINGGEYDYRHLWQCKQCILNRQGHSPSCCPLLRGKISHAMIVQKCAPKIDWGCGACWRLATGSTSAHRRIWAECPGPDLLMPATARLGLLKNEPEEYGLPANT